MRSFGVLALFLLLGLLGISSAGANDPPPTVCDYNTLTSCAQTPEQPMCAACKNPGCDNSTVTGCTVTAQYDNKCFYLIEPPQNTHIGYTYDEAKSNCYAANTIIASVHSIAENDVIYGMNKDSVGLGNFHSYWIGLELTRPVPGLVSAEWADKSQVDYGAPVTNSLRVRQQLQAPPTSYANPWVLGEPYTGAANELRTHFLTFGKQKRRWESYDGAIGPVAPGEPGTPSNGYVCVGCPAGWTRAAFNGHCYKAFVNDGTGSDQTFADLEKICDFYGPKTHGASIESDTENNLVYQLALQASKPTTRAIALSLRLTHPAGAGVYNQIGSRTWTDGSTIDLGDYAYTDGSALQAGRPPWAIYNNPPPTPQPDNFTPSPADCVHMYIHAPEAPGGTWDDNGCSTTASGIVCEMVL